MRILVVEDEVETARLLADRLKASGYETDVAGSVGEARKVVCDRIYSLTVLDRRLPDGDGLGLVGDIRRRMPSARILMLSALDGLSDRIAGLDAGADDYLVKPFEIDEFLARVRANYGAGRAASRPFRSARCPSTRRRGRPASTGARSSRIGARSPCSRR